MFIVSFFDLYKEYNICLISFLSFSELFAAFNWAKVISNLLNIWFGVKSFKPCPCCFLTSLLKSIIWMMISNISFGFSFFIFYLAISLILSFKLLHLFLISFTNILFSASFISNKFFAKSIGVEKSKYFLNKSLFIYFDFLSIKEMPLLMNSSSFFYFDSSFDCAFDSFFILNILPLNGKIPSSKKRIISFLAWKNSVADFKTFFFSSIFNGFFAL